MESVGNELNEATIYSHEPRKIIYLSIEFE